MHQLLDNQHLITIKQNSLQLIRIIIRSTIQISSLSLNLFLINFCIINGHQKRQAKRERM